MGVVKMTKHLKECLDMVKNKIPKGQWFVKWDVIMMPRTEYNLNRLEDLGELKSVCTIDNNFRTQKYYKWE